MYSILTCAAVALLVGVGGMLLDLWGWIAAIIFGLVVFAATWIILARRLMAKLQPQFERVRKQAEAGLTDGARQSLLDLLPMGRWVPMLSGQIHAQLGALAQHAGDEENALHHLAHSSRRGAEGQLLLAAIHHRNGRVKEALSVLASAAPHNRGHALFYNVYAWLLQKEGRVDEAMAQLNRFLKKAPDHQIGKQNLLRLQNGQRMDLKSFGSEWFALGIERPPTSMGELRTGRKGFRQAPKKQKLTKKPTKSKKRK